MIKLVDFLVNSFQESLEAERALNHQITGLVGLCMQLVQEHAQPMGVVPPDVD
jgi:hypothetical protein